MTRKVEVEKIDPVRRRLSVEIPSEEVEAELARVYGELERSARVPGFRPGRVPRRVLERYFGHRVRSEVAERLIEESFREVVREKALRPVGDPEVVPDELSAGEPLRYRVTFEVLPDIELRRYLGLPARKAVRPVTDADVDAVLERMRQEAAQLIPVTDRDELRPGDVAEVDYEIVRDGRVVRRAEAARLLVGGEAAEETPARHLVGMRVGERREVELPAEEQEEGQAGQSPGRMVAMLRRLFERRLPELDDEFAKDCGDTDSLAEMRERIRQALEAEAEREAERELRRTLLEQLVAEHQPQVPETLVAARAREMARDAIRQMGIRPPTETAERELRRSLEERLRPLAQQRVQQDFLLEAIAEREGIEVTERDIDDEVERMAALEPHAAGELRTLLRRPDLRAGLRSSLRRSRALELVVRSAVVETVQAHSSVADAEASG